MLVTIESSSNCSVNAPTNTAKHLTLYSLMIQTFYRQFKHWDG